MDRSMHPARRVEIESVLRVLTCAIYIWLACAGSGAAAPPTHPLDALTPDEIVNVVALLRAAGYVDGQTRYGQITLREPVKTKVLSWRAGEPFERRAFVVARQGRRTYQGLVNVTEGKVEQWREVDGVQPRIFFEEIVAAHELTVANPDWQAAMRRRGYATFDRIFCVPMSAGNFAPAKEENRRLLRVQCFDTTGAKSHLYGRPIEGLTGTIDLDARRLVKLVDTGPVPVSSQGPTLDEKSLPALRSELLPILNEAPQGHNFRLDGNRVTWGPWSFHWRMDARVGPVISLVDYLDGSRERSVLYQGHVSEMFVPYMDPDPNWYFRSYMDVGEYGFGLLASPLSPGTDCPTDAVMLDAVLPDDRGAPTNAERVVCIFERNTAAPLWRHFEIVTGAHESRPEVELVLRTAPAVGNYDYIIDWVFTQSGEIRIEVGATGILAVKGVPTRAMTDSEAAADTAHGTLVAPNLVATYHDHFLSFRLDLDIDGPANTFMRERVVTKAVSGGSPRRSIWEVEPTTMFREGPVSGDHGQEIWRVVNLGERTSLGHHPGYEISIDHGATSALSDTDDVQRRAAFSRWPLWVTALDPNELYAAGLYPNQSKGGDGLPSYASQGRSIYDSDLVVWCTLGFHHVARAEDWPVTSTIWHRLRLRPFNFFDRNPALDVRSDFSTTH